MKLMKKIFLLIFFITASVVNLFAETIILNSGKAIEADIVELTRDSIKVNIMGAEVTYDLDQIKSIGAEKDSAFSEKYLKREKEDVNKENKELKNTKQIQDLLKKRRKELKQKRKDYIEAKKNLKNVASTGFLGFGRTKEETQALLKAKKEVAKLKKEYNGIKQNIKGLKKEFSLAKDIEALQKKQKHISNSF
jgi:predicted RNase H-like nuclease (RuvC/YqgF family)